MTTDGGLLIPVGLDFTSGLADLVSASTSIERTADSIATSFDAIGKNASDAFDRGRKALAGMAASGQQGTKEYAQLVAEVKAAQKETRSFEDALASVDKQLDNLDDQNPFEKIVGALATGEILGNAGDFLTSFAENGVSARDAMLDLQVQTGLVGAELAGVRDQAEDAFLKGVGENVAEAIQAVGTARQQLGKILPEDQIGQFTADAAQLGKTYDHEVNEVIGKSRTFLQNFNLDAEKGAGLIALGMRDAGNGMDDVLDTLDEYSQLWKEAGLSAEQSIGLMTRGVQAGARDTDKLADAIKETGIRLKAGDISNSLGDISGPISKQIQEIVKAGEAGSLSAAEVMQKTSAAIGTAFDGGQISEQMRSQLQIAVAGTPAEDIGADLYQKIFSAPIDTAAIQASADKALADVRKAAGPSNIFESLLRQFDVVKTRVSEFAAPVIAGLGGVLQTVGSLGPSITLVSDNFDKIKDVAGGLGKTMMGAIGPAAPWLIGITIAVGLFTLLYNEVEGFRNFVDGAISFVVKVFETVSPALSAMGDVLLSVGQLVWEWLIAPFEVAWEIAASLAEAIFGAGSSAFDSTKFFKMLAGVVEVAVKWFKGAKDSIDHMRAAIEGAKAKFLSFINDIGGAIGDLFSLDFEGFVDKIENAGDRANAAANSATRDALAKQNMQKTIDSANESFVAGTQDLVTKAAEAAERLSNAVASKNQESIKKFSAEAKKIFKENIDAARGFATSTFLPEEAREAAANAQKQIEELRDKVFGETKKNPAKVTTKLAPPTKAEIVSFGDDVSKILAEATTISKQIEISIETDATKKLGLEFKEKERLLALDIANERAALKKKADDALASKKVLSEAENATLQDALNALDVKERALRARMDKERSDAITALARQRVDEESKSLNEVYSREIDLLKIQQSAITGTTLEEIRRRNELAQEEQELAQQQELEILLQGLEAETLARLNAARIQGILTDEEVREEEKLLRARLLGSNPKVQAIIDRQKADRKKVVDDGRTAEMDALAKTDLGYQTSLALRGSFISGFYSDADQERTEGLQREKEDLQGQAKQIYQDYLDGKISSYEEYSAKVADINQRMADNEQKLQDASLSAWKSFANGFAAVFDDIARRQSTLADEATANTVAAFDKFLEQSKEGSKATQAEIADTMAKMDESADATYKAVATGFGATLASVTIQGKLTMKSFLHMVNDSVKAIIPSLIAQLFATTFATLGPIGGAIAYGLSVGTLMGLLSLADAAIDRFEFGGLVPGGEQLIRINEKGKEYVTDHESTRVNLGALTWMNQNKGRPVEEYVLQKYGAGMTGAGGDSGVAARVEKLEQTVSEKLDTVNEKIGTLAENMESTHHVEVSGKTSIDTKEMVTTFEQARYRAIWK